MTTAKIEHATTIDQVATGYTSKQIATLLPLLPLLNLKGAPYSLVDHMPFAPLFDLRVPRRMYWKCGRQVAKTTGMAAQAVLQAGTQPHFNVLFVSPRYEQIRRVSTNYVKAFIENSSIYNLIQNTTTDNSVLQKTFLNGSRMYFSFAFLDADRIRGLSVDAIYYDEIQDIDIDFVPVIREAMSASTYMLERFFGTPKTLDNTLQALWDDSSQAEWHIKCSCGYDNIPAKDYDLLKMLGDIGPVCAKCGNLVNPRTGRWVHGVPERVSGDAGYHIPQIILPMHYEDPENPGQIPTQPSEKWLELLRKRDGHGGYNTAKFLNEVLGESCDVGQKLISLTDIREASKLNVNEWRAALARINDYAFRTLGVDWGGGGEDGISTTALAVVGLNIRTGKTDCIYGERLNLGFDGVQEAKRCLDVYKAFRCNTLCHDYGGAGSVRELLLVQAGLPLSAITPFMYIRATYKKMVEAHKPGGYQQRVYYTLDKTRSLLLMAQCIKSKYLLLPEFKSTEALTKDLLALIEERQESGGHADIYLVTRSAKQTDDFAHALNFAATGVWFHQNRWPDISRLENIKLTPEQRRALIKQEVL